jgi:hypothetical protein
MAKQWMRTEYQKKNTGNEDDWEEMGQTMNMVARSNQERHRNKRTDLGEGERNTSMDI